MQRAGKHITFTNNEADGLIIANPFGWKKKWISVNENPCRFAKIEENAFHQIVCGGVSLNRNDSQDGGSHSAKTIQDK